MISNFGAVTIGQNNIMPIDNPPTRTKTKNDISPK